MEDLSNSVHKEAIRPLANYHPDIWGDIFLDYTPLDEETHEKMKKEANKLKEEVRKELLTVTNSKEKLLFIDAIQRLGVAYHFEEEIEVTLQEFLKNYGNDYSMDDDLEFDSLRFRLFRQQGFYVSCDVFEKYKDENGSFMECLKTDVQGLLNLYEASELRLHEENVLDEALSFTTTHLTTLASNLSSPLAKQITHALAKPLFKCTIRLEAKCHQFSIYESNALHHEALLRLAKLDFNFVQILHKKELSDLIRWSRRMGLKRKFPFARDRVVEAYIWAMAVYYEPNYSFGRNILTKVAMLATIVDDMYDAYGTIDELELFTEAILRWDKNCMNKLPDYMKLLYEILLDTFHENEQVLADEGRSYAGYYLQKELQALCQAYLQESKWCHEKYVPTYEEYTKNVIVSSAFILMQLVSYQGMGKIATKNATQWICQNSKAIKATCIIAKLMDDIGGHKFERKRNHVASAVECYMANFRVSEEEAYKQLRQQIEESWKDLRAEIFGPSPTTVAPMTLLTTMLNLTRSLYDVYENDEDGFTFVNGYMRSKVETLLIELAI